MSKKRILIINSGIYEGIKTVNSTKYSWLSREFCGDVIHVLYEKDLINTKLSDFSLVGVYIPRYYRKFKILKNIYFILSSLKNTKNNYDVIISRNPLLCGFLGLLLSKKISAKHIVEVNGNYANEQVWNEGENKIFPYIKHKLSLYIIPIVLNLSDCIRLLYPDQLKPYTNIKNTNRYVIHEFTQINNSIQPNKNNYVLSMGSPWFIKGFDILIDAFKLVLEKHPNVKLKIVAWLPGEAKKEMEFKKKGIKNIELINPVEYYEAQEYISNCLFFVLASRTEAMGRVILESMAKKKAVIASNVDGIPHYVKDNITGLLFQSENSTELSEKISLLIEDPILRKKLSVEGYNYTHRHYNESQYILEYKKMIMDLVC